MVLDRTRFWLTKARLDIDYHKLEELLEDAEKDGMSLEKIPESSVELSKKILLLVEKIIDKGNEVLKTRNELSDKSAERVDKKIDRAEKIRDFFFKKNKEFGDNRLVKA